MPPETTRGDAHLDRPRLVSFTPVLSRGPGCMQVGLDQDRVVVLEGLAPGLVELLPRLDGGHHRDELAARAVGAGSSVADVDWMLRTLDRAGLLEPGGTEPEPRRNARVRLIGAGPLGRAVAERMTGPPLDILHIIDNEPPDQTLYPRTGVLGTQAEALRQHLGEAGGTAVRVANHWAKPEEVRPDLTIVASDRLECDRVVAHGLLRADQPHLLLRVRAGGVLVGPLVLPGQTACLRCTDLYRRDADAGWATLLPQLCRMRMPVVASLVAWAGGVSAAQALAYLRGAPRDLWRHPGDLSRGLHHPLARLVDASRLRLRLEQPGRMVAMTTRQGT